MNNAIDIIRKYSNKEPRIILTVSPVPLLRTFSNRDIIVANTYSKSVLRAVADELSSKYDDVDYFPSYEMVANSPREIAWRHDQRHVTKEMVWHIMHRFKTEYTDQNPEAIVSGAT